MNDPYRILGVDKSATQEEIRNAYRNLAKKHHPDLNPGSKAAEARFKDIGIAYEMIGRKENREKFDRGEYDAAEGGAREGRAGRGGPFYSQTQSSADGMGGRYSYSFADEFDEDLFAGFGLPPEEEVYRMDVDLADTVSGKEKDITLPSGKRLRVKIPPGVTEGTRLRFAGQGRPGRRTGKPVDVYVELHIEPDPRFEISGPDLISRLKVPVGEAVFGGELRAPTLDGNVVLNIPPRSTTGTRLKLRGKGLYDRAKKTRGDQIVIVELVLPEPYDLEFEAALRTWYEKRKETRHDAR